MVRRYELSDEAFGLIEDLLPTKTGGRKTRRLHQGTSTTASRPGSTLKPPNSTGGRRY